MGVAFSEDLEVEESGLRDQGWMGGYRDTPFAFAFLLHGF